MASPIRHDSSPIANHRSSAVSMWPTAFSLTPAMRIVNALPITVNVGFFGHHREKVVATMVNLDTDMPSHKHRQYS